MKTIYNKPENAISFQVAANKSIIVEAKQLCHDVYLNHKYIDAPYPGKIIPYTHDASSVYIVAINSLQDVVGTIRLTAGVPFKTFEVWQNNFYPDYNKLIHEVQNTASLEIGALAVRKDHSVLKISWGLYKATHRYCMAMNVRYGVISMDARALRSLQMVGWNVMQIGAPKYYFGSLTVPAIIPVHQQSKKIINNNFEHHMHQAA
jgi:hypothetical protein